MPDFKALTSEFCVGRNGTNPRLEAAFHRVREEALEEAAALCETSDAPIPIESYGGTKREIGAAVARQLADEIRALKGQESRMPMPDELARLDIEVEADPRTGQVILSLPEEGVGVLALTPPEALALAERLSSIARALDTGCVAHTRDRTRCTLKKGHAGRHVTGYGGWFAHQGAAEQSCVPGEEPHVE